MIFKICAFLWVLTCIGFCGFCYYNIRKAERRLKKDIPYEMSVLYQKELDERIAREASMRTFNNTDFADYYVECLKENPTMTEREIVWLYVHDTSDELQDSNSGSLEEGGQS